MSTEEEIYKTRIGKLKNFQKQKILPYPSKIKPHRDIGDVLLNFKDLKKKNIVMVGRISNIRKHGGSTFLHFKDESGKMQAYLKKDKLGEKSYQFFLKNFDIGDFVLFEGELFSTKRGEETIEASTYQILAKSLLPLPEKWHGLCDVEERFRKRYLDLLMNSEIKEKFILRSKIISEIRKFLEKKGFLEVETPILQEIPGGAAAEPFKTHLNALNFDLYLRIASELHLKRLLVGGFEKVFEIGRVFRNEGIDASHNPDFTLCEFYWAYHNYEDLMSVCEEMIIGLVEKLFAEKKIQYQEKSIDFTPPFDRLDFFEFLTEKIGADPRKLSEKEIKKVACDLKISINKKSNAKLLDDIFKKYRGEIIRPTFILHQPIKLTPLAKSLEKDSKRAARFNLIIGGWEMANAFSELNNPIEQEKRFKEQAEERAKGDVEAHPFDKEFIEALSYGMPPAAGCGIGIDRLVAFLTGFKTLREAILFPLMRPRK